MMMSLQGSRSHTSPDRFPMPGTDIHTPLSASTSKMQRNIGRSMRTIRSNLFRRDAGCSFNALPYAASCTSQILTESVIDMKLGELVSRSKAEESTSMEDDLLEMTRTFSYSSSSYSSDVSGELNRLANTPAPEIVHEPAEKSLDLAAEPCVGFLEGGSDFSTEIIESISPEDLQPTVKICVDGLKSSSIQVKRSAAGKLRLLAKNRTENRALIGESGAIPALVPLLRCSDSRTQEHAVTALLNISLLDQNKRLITSAGAIKSLVYVLKTGTETSKQNAACALLSLALIEENRNSIGASGAIPPLVSLLINGSNRGKKDALTTLYKLCSVKQNKERAVSAGVVNPLIDIVAEQGSGMAEKAMVVLSSIATIEEGKQATVDGGGIGVFVEALEDGSSRGKEFALGVLQQLCSDSVKNLGFLLREGGIPPLVILSQTGSPRAMNKAETLLRCLRQLR